MTNYVSCLLAIDTAKRKLTELFNPDILGPADHRTIAIAAQTEFRAARTTVRHYHSAPRWFILGQEFRSHPEDTV
jgi:hypothetical protein